MQADGLSLRDATDAFSLDGASFTISWGETVGIAGVEGNGQSELGMILADLADLADLGAGRWFADGRELMRAARQITCAGVATVLEDRHAVACATQMSVAQNMLDSRLPQVSRIGLIDLGGDTGRGERDDGAVRCARRRPRCALWRPVGRHPAKGGAGARIDYGEFKIPAGGAADPRPRRQGGGGGLRPHPVSLRGRGGGAAGVHGA